jgi:hypothetical protein
MKERGFPGSQAQTSLAGLFRCKYLLPLPHALTSTDGPACCCCCCCCCCWVEAGVEGATQTSPLHPRIRSTPEGLKVRVFRESES